MKPRATGRKIRRSYTLTPEAFAFLKESRQRLGAASNSETLELLIHEARRGTKLREIDAAYKDYYDTASDEDLAEQRKWAEMTGPNMFLGVPD